jgi:hypothetical protein
MAQPGRTLASTLQEGPIILLFCHIDEPLLMLDTQG